MYWQAGTFVTGSTFKVKLPSYDPAALTAILEGCHPRLTVMRKFFTQFGKSDIRSVVNL
jgi:hypothetical protein